MAESSPHTKRDEALRQCSVCTSNLNGAYVKCVECKRKVTTLCIPCFQLGAEAGEHSRGHNYEVVDPVGPPICPVGSDGLVWNLSDDLTLFDFVREYKLGNWEESMKYFPDKRKALAARSHFDQFFLNGAVWNLVRSTEEPTYEGPSNYKESFCFNPAEETTKECGRIFMAHWKAKVERIMAKHPPLRVSLDVIRTLFEKYPLDLTGVASHMISCPIPIVLSEKDRPMSPTEPKKKHGKKGKNQKSVAEAKLHKARLAASKKRLTVLHRRFPESLHLMRERRPFSDHTGKVKDDDLNALGYMPARDDFEVEIRNRSELLICGNNLFERAVCDAGREFENEVKRIRMQRYRRDQKEREVAKGIVREFGLVSKFVTALKTNGDMKPKKPMDALMQRLSRCFDQELVSTLRTGDTHFHMAQGIVSKYRRFRFKGITVVSVCPPNQKRVLRVSRPSELLSVAAQVIANSSGGGRVFVTADGDADDDVEEEFEEAAATSSTAVHSGTLLVRTAARPLTLRYRRLRLLKGGREAICVEFGDQKAPLRQAARVPGQSSPSASGASASRNGTYRANGAPSAPAPVRRGTPSSFGSRQGTPSRFASPNGHSVRSPASSGRLTPSMLKKPPDNEKEDKKAKRKNSREEPKPSTSAQKSLIPDNPFFSQALMGNVRPHIPKVVKKVVQSIVRKPAELLRSSKESSSKESSSSKLKEPQRKTSNAQMIDDLFNQPCSSSSIRSPSTSRKIHEKSQASSTEKPQESPRVHTPLVSSPKGERQKDSPRPSERERERRREKASDKPKVKKKEESIGRRRDSVGEEEDRGRRDEQRPLAKEEKKRVVEGPKEEEESAKFEDERPKETVVDMVHGKTKDDKQKNEEERDLEAPKIAEKIEEERPKEISYDVKADEENKGVEEIPKEQDKVNEKVEKEKEEEEEEEEEEVEEEKMEVEEEKKAEEEEVPKEMAMIVTENVSESESETDSDSESESESESDSDDSESSDLPGPIQKDVKKDSQPSAKMDDLAFTPIHGYSMLETYGTFAEDEDDDEDPPEKPTTPDFGAPKVERYHTTGEDIISWYDDVESFEKEDKEEGDGKKESTLVVVTPSGSPIRMASKTPSAKSSFVSPSSTVGDALKSPGPEYDNAEKTSKNADKEEPAMSPVKEEAPVQEAPRKKEGPSSLFKNVHEDSSEMEDSSETSDESSETSVEEEEELRNLEDMEAEEASPKEEEPLFLSPLHFSPIHSDDSSSDEADIWPSKMLAIEAPKEVEEPKTEEMAVAVDVSGLHPDEFECEDVSPATSPGSAPNDSLSLTKEFPELRENLGTEEFSESFMEDILKGSTYREAFGHATPVVEEPEAEEDRIASPLINFFEDVPRTGEHLRATVTEVEDLRQLPPSSVPRFMHELPVQWQTPRFTRPIDEIASGLRGTLEAADYPEGYRQMGYYVPPIIQQNIYVQQNVNVQQHVTIITDSHGNEKRTITNNMSTSSLVTHRTDFFQSTADMECNQFGEATDMPESGNPKRGNPKAKPPRRSRSTGSREKTRAQRTRTQEGQSSQNMTSGHRGSWRRSDENLPRGSDAQKVTGATDPVELPNTTGADDPKKSPPNTNIPGFLPQYDTGSQYPAFDHLATDPESPAPQTPSSSDPKNLQVAIYREPPSRPLAMERYRPLGEMLCGQLAIEACRSDEDDLPEPRENKEVTSIVQTFHTDQQVAILKPKPARPRRPSFKLTLNVTIPPVLMNLEPFIGNTTTPKLAVMAVVSARTLDLMNGKKKQTFCVFDLQGVKAISEAHKIIKEQEERSMLRFKKKPPKAIEGGECQKSIKHRGVAEELGISREELEVVCPPKLQAPRKPLALKGPEKIDDLNAYFDSDLGGAMDVRDLFAPTIFDFSWQGSERYLTRLCRLVFNSFMNSHSEGFLRKAATAANERGKMEKERRETERRARVSLAETVCNTVLSKIVSQKDFMESWLEDLVVKMVIYKNMQRLVRTEVKMARDRQLATMARSKSRCLWTEDVDGTVRLVCQSVLARKMKLRRVISQACAFFSSGASPSSPEGVKFLAERETGDKEHGFVLDFEQFAVGPGGGGGDASKKKLFVAIAAEHFSNTLFGAIFEPLHDVDDGVEVSEKTLFEMAKKAVSVDIARSSVPREVGERILKAMAPKLEFYVDSEKIAVVTVPLGCLRRLREESRLKVTKGQLSRAKKRSERAAILDKYRNRRLEAFISTTFDGILEKIVREKASEVHNDLLGAHMFQKFCMETVSDYSASLSSMAWTEEHINAYSQFTMERLSRKTIWFRTQIGVFLELQTEWLLEDAIVSRCKAALLAKRSVEKVLEDEVTFHFNAVLSSESWAEDLLEAEIVAQCSAALTSERWAKKLVDEEIAAECKKVLCSQRCIKQLLDEAISTQFEAVVFAQFGCDLLVEELLVSQCNTALMTERWMEEFVQEEIVTCCRRIFYSEGLMQSLVEGEVVRHGGMELFVERSSEQLLQEAVVASSQVVLCAERCAQQVVVEEVSAQWEAIVFSEASFEDLLHEEIVFRCKSLFYAESWFDDFIEGAIISRCRHVRVVEDAAVKFWDRIIAWHCLQVVSSERAAVVVNGCMRTYFRRQLRRAVEVARDEDVDGFYEDLFTGELEQVAVRQQTDASAQHTTSDASQYDVLFKIFTRSFRSEYWIDVFYRCATRDVIDDICLDVLMSIIVPRLSPEVYRQKDILERRQYLPPEYRSQDRCNRYNYCAIAYQIARSIINGERLTEYMTGVYFRRALRSHARTAIIEKAVDQVFDHMVREVVAENACMIFEAIEGDKILDSVAELSTTAMIFYAEVEDSVLEDVVEETFEQSLIHYIMYDRQLLKLADEEVDKYRRQRKLTLDAHTEHLVATLEKEMLPQFCLEAMQKVVAVPNVAVEPSMDDVANVLEDASLAETKELSKEAEVSKMRLQRVMLENRAEVVMRTEHQKTFEFRANTLILKTWDSVYSNYTKNIRMSLRPGANESAYEFLLKYAIAIFLGHVKMMFNYDILREAKMPELVRLALLDFLKELYRRGDAEKVYKTVSSKFKKEEIALILKRKWDEAKNRETAALEELANHVKMLKEEAKKAGIKSAPEEEAQTVKRMEMAKRRESPVAGPSGVSAPPETERTSNGSVSSDGRSGSSKRASRSPIRGLPSWIAAGDAGDVQRWGEVGQVVDLEDFGIIKGSWDSGIDLPFLRSTRSIDGLLDKEAWAKAPQKEVDVVYVRRPQRAPLEEASSSSEEEVPVAQKKAKKGRTKNAKEKEIKEESEGASAGTQKEESTAFPGPSKRQRKSTSTAKKTTAKRRPPRAGTKRRNARKPLSSESEGERTVQRKSRRRAPPPLAIEDDEVTPSPSPEFL